MKRRLITLLIISTFVFLFQYCSDDNTVDNKDNIDNGESFLQNANKLILYEANISAMSSSGNFNGVKDKLTHIKNLGCNVLWLMPVFPEGELNSVSSPYCIKNFKAVNPDFGSEDDLKSLISAAHSMGIAVILDWVANHTSWDNPWIENKDWYTQDGNGNIISPSGTNWADVADLNYDNTDMRNEMISSMKYWVENFGVDGFRCDAADYVPLDFWRQAIESINGSTNKELLFLAEGARSDHFTAGFDLNFSWDFYNALKEVFADGSHTNTIYYAHLNEYSNISTGKHKLRFTTNHDETAWDNPPTNIFGGVEGSLSAFVIMLYTGGIPLIYSSQEVGITSNLSFFYKENINWSQNPDMLSEYQNLMKIYSENEVFHSGEYNYFSYSNIMLFKRVLNSDTVYIGANVRNSTSSIILPAELKNRSMVNLFTGNEVTMGENLDLDNYEYLILKPRSE